MFKSVKGGKWVGIGMKRGVVCLSVAFFPGHCFTSRQDTSQIEIEFLLLISEANLVLRYLLAYEAEHGAHVRLRSTARSCCPARQTLNSLWNCSRFSVAAQLRSANFRVHMMLNAAVGLYSALRFREIVKEAINLRNIHSISGAANSPVSHKALHICPSHTRAREIAVFLWN